MQKPKGLLSFLCVLKDKLKFYKIIYDYYYQQFHTEKCSFVAFSFEINSICTFVFEDNFL